VAVLGYNSRRDLLFRSVACRWETRVSLANLSFSPVGVRTARQPAGRCSLGERAEPAREASNSRLPARQSAGGGRFARRVCLNFSVKM
jgi:hypothetical protein